MEYAHELLEELHPLENTPAQEAFPWLGAITCYKGKAAPQVSEADHEAQLLADKKTIIVGGKEVKKRAPKKKKNNLDDEVSKEEPLAKLGFGIVAYMNLLWALTWTFLLYTFMLVPTMMYFS